MKTMVVVEGGGWGGKKEVKGIVELVDFEVWCCVG